MLGGIRFELQDTQNRLAVNSPTTLPLTSVIYLNVRPLIYRHTVLSQANR